MKRTKVLWKPHKDICKRFNVPEPFGGLLIEEKPKRGTKFSVFDYIEVPTNSKTNFITPVIVPKKVQQMKKLEPKSRMSAKEFFNEETKIVIPKLFDKTDKKGSPEKELNETSSLELPSSSTSSLSVIQKPSFSKPKTELEQKVEENLNKRPEEKKDLFKAIFCDTSDEEDDETGTNNKPSTSVPDAEKLKLLESFVATKPAGEFNILRNKSPPRGIFKNILERTDCSTKDDENRTKNVSSDSSSDSNESDNEQESYYGPKLPKSKPAEPENSGMEVSATTSQAFLSSNIDDRLAELLKRNKEAVVFEEWVEKDSNSGKKKKKKEKHSKSSKKSKKHKKEKKKKDKK